MANRWQMAKAFGRAMMEPIKAKNAGKVRDEVGAIAKKLDDGPRNAYGEGITEGFNDLGKAVQFEKKRKIPELRERMDELSDEATDKSLQDAFNEGFDEAVERRKAERLNEWDWDGKPENQMGDDWDYNAAKDRDDAAEQQVRDELIQELKRGMPLSDFFEKYRNYGE